MKKKTVLFSFVSILAALFVSHCSDSGPTAGGGTQVGNAMTYGYVYNSNNTPAAGARVRFIPVAYNPRGSSGLKIDSTVTDSRGYYQLSELGSGKYNVLASNETGASFRDSVEVVEDTTNVGKDTLRTPGSIHGVVKLVPPVDSAMVFVILLGTNTYCMADANGEFVINNLGHGIFNALVLSSVPDYSSVGVEWEVNSGDTTVLADTLELAWQGVPRVTGLSLGYDTLKQIVTITWGKIDTAIVKGYIVYRRNVDSNTVFTRINAVLLSDTLYRDSTGIQNMTYEYKVSVLSKADMEGIKSIGVTSSVLGSYRVVSTLQKGLLAEAGGVVFVAQMAADSGFTVRAYDGQLNLRNTIELEHVLNQPQVFDVDAEGNFYFLDNFGIFKFGPTGNLLDTLDIWSNNENKTLVAYDSVILLAAGVVREYSTNGDSLAGIDEMPDFKADGLAVQKGQVLVGGRANEVRVYDFNLWFVGNWSLDFIHGETVWGLASDELGNVYVLGYHGNPDFYTLLIYNQARVYVGKYDLGASSKYFVVADGKIYLNQGDSLLVLGAR